MTARSKSSDAVDVPQEREQATEDEIDAAIARKRLAEIERDPTQLVRGNELEEQLAEILE